MAIDSRVLIQIQADTKDINAKLAGLGQVLSTISSNTQNVGTLSKTSWAIYSAGINQALEAAQKFARMASAAFNEVKDTVEGFNMAVVQSAAMITGMMEKDTRPLAERYQEAKTYAQQLQVVLEQIDKETLLTARDLSNVTAEMHKQGVVLDVTNRKQVEAFKALSNAVAVVSAGYPSKEVQIRQEIRALLSGQTRTTDTLSGMLKAQVGDLKEQIELHKQQGDLIEWLGEQLQGFAAASGDIEMTWEAVSTSMQTIWRQLLRGAFAEPFHEVVSLLKQMSEWFSDHREQIQEGLGRAWNVVKSLVTSVWELFKLLAPLLKPLLWIVEGIAKAFEDLSLWVIPGMVKAIAAIFEKVEEFYNWLKEKTVGSEEGGDVLLGRTGKGTQEGLTEADFQNTQRGLTTVSPPKLKRPPADDEKKDKEADKIQAVIDKLMIEEAQLGKTSREQAIYNALKEAGFKIDEKTGQFKGEEKKIRQISELVERIHTQKEALAVLNQVSARAEEVMKSNRTESEEWADRLDDLRDLVNSGRISWEAYAIAVSKVNAEMAKPAAAKELAELEKRKNEIAAVEIRGETPAIEIAKRKQDLLRREIELRQRLLEQMPRYTADQESAYNSEVRALEGIRKELVQQSLEVRKYEDAWSGVSQGLKTYIDEVTAMADQLKGIVEGAFRGMEDALVEFVKTGKLSFSDLVDSIISDLARLMVRQTITAPLANALSSGLSGLLPSFSYHEGGRGIGEASGFRLIPAEAFASARRYHSGLTPDEVPLIVQRREMPFIFTPEQMKGLAGLMQSSMNLSMPITVDDPGKGRQLRRNVEREVQRTLKGWM